MLRSAAVSRIQQGLGFRTDLDDAIVDALQEAQREFEIGSSLPWFLVEEDATVTVTFNSHAVAFPTGFLRLVEEEGPYYTDVTTGLRYLEVRPYDEMLKYYSDYDSGAPRAFSVRSTNFAVFPLPDTSYSITLSYYKAAEVLDSDIENAWLANTPDLLLNRAGMLIAEDLEHSAAYQKFERKYTFWRQKYLSEIAWRADQNLPRQMGVNQ